MPRKKEQAPFPPPPTSPSLSSSQRALIAHKKQIALAKRKLRDPSSTSPHSTFGHSLAPSNWNAAPCSQPISSDSSGSPVVRFKLQNPVESRGARPDGAIDYSDFGFHERCFDGFDSNLKSENDRSSRSVRIHGSISRPKQDLPEDEGVLLKPSRHSCADDPPVQYPHPCCEEGVELVVGDSSDLFQDALNDLEEGQYKPGAVENADPLGKASGTAKKPEDECTDEEEELFIPLSTGEQFWNERPTRNPFGRRLRQPETCQRRPSSRYSSRPITSSRLEDGPLKFSMQQMKVLEAVAAGKSVFMTGAAGTGKSHVLHYIVRILQRWFGKEVVYVTASTGLAACSLSGTTLHSFAGIGLGNEDREVLASKVFAKKDPSSRWRNAKVLIIDEISMIDGELFDKLNYVAKVLRDDNRAFGGIQLIVTGDFFQLPPVKPSNPRKYFAFDAECWDQCFDLQIELQHVFRQSHGGFVGMLQEIRRGNPSSQTIETLQKCLKPLPDDDLGITPTRLYPLRVDVKEENTYNMKVLAKEIVSYEAQDSYQKSIHRYMLDNMRAEKVLHLCIGAQVMLIKNLDTPVGLVNGARGVVVDFGPLLDSAEKEKDKEIKHAAPLLSPTGMWPIVRFACDERERTIGPQKETVEDRGVEVATRIQVPLILAWAVSVHKCQGMTLDKVETDLSKAFEYGMVYVALSRVKDLNGLRLTGFDPGRIKVHPSVSSFYKKLAINKAAGRLA